MWDFCTFIRYVRFYVQLWNRSLATASLKKSWSEIPKPDQPAAKSPKQTRRVLPKPHLAAVIRAVQKI
ncbi:hypothetical protein J4G07_02880 [Candidatus Poribacteria bacterium]|nr:hypothetical protein [Candidatus Poribacteria bacterium]